MAVSIARHLSEKLIFVLNTIALGDIPAKHPMSQKPDFRNLPKALTNCGKSDFLQFDSLDQ